MISKLFAIAFSAVLALTLTHPLPKESHKVLPFLARAGVPVYGNWCGPGHGGFTRNDIPCIDEIDCKCRAHDLCYERLGNLNCNCDNDLVNSLRGLSSPLATTIRNYFARSPCLAPRCFPAPKMCKKCLTIFGNIVCRHFPCGFRQKCEKIVVAVNKDSLRLYDC